MSGRSAGIGAAGTVSPGTSPTELGGRRLVGLLLAVLVGALVAALVAAAQGHAEAQETVVVPGGPSAPVTAFPVAGPAPVLGPSDPAPTASSGGGGHRLVALGDSWAAGSATGSDPATGPCRRSADAYPALVAPVTVDVDWTSRACATTRSGPNTQFDALRPDTEVVTVTVGADATGLGGYARACGATGDVAACDVAAARFDRALSALPAALDASLGELRARVPGARVLVTGLPRPAEGLACLSGSADTARAVRLDTAADRMDGVLADRTGAAGMTFVDVRDAFAGHGVCGADPWITGFTAPDPLVAAAPTVAGQGVGYRGAVESALRTAVTTPPAVVLPTATPLPAPVAPATEARDAAPAPFTPLPSRAIEGLLQPLFSS